MMDNTDYPSLVCDRGWVLDRSDSVSPPPSPPVVGDDDPESTNVDSFPNWFSEFLNDRQTRKPSAHTMKAYRQDFTAIASLVAGGDPARLAATDITKESMRAAFAAYAHDHEAASIRRCWSRWNVLCTFLYTTEQLAANPMQLVGRPKLATPLPKALPRTVVEALLETVAHDRGSRRQTDWAERDLALILTGSLGLTTTHDDTQRSAEIDLSSSSRCGQRRSHHRSA
jgi:integrase/recombinase XerC